MNVMVLVSGREGGRRGEGRGGGRRLGDDTDI